jgi:hypothetical protein
MLAKAPSVVAEVPLKLALRKTLWVQDFAARLADLGAPIGLEALLALGAEQFALTGRLDAKTAAELMWSEWPTET